MPWMTVAFVALVSVGLAAIPTALVVAADRQPWPVQVRMLLAAHHSQLAFGAVALGVMDATVVDVAPGARPEWVVVCTRAQRRERLWLADGPDAQLLRYWQAEAIPVLLLQRDRDEVEVHGPSGIVAVQTLAPPDSPGPRPWGTA